MNKNKKLISKKMVVIGVPILVIVLIAGVLFNNSAKASSVELPAMLSATVTRGDISMEISSNGTVEASSKSQIRSESSGTVYDIVSVGDQVEAGDLLFTVQSNSLNVSTESDRLSYVKSTNTLNNLYADLSDLTVYASNNGTITIPNNTIGESYSSNQVFATITDESNMQILAPFAPNLIDDLSVGDTASITLDIYYSVIDGVVSKIGNSPKPYENGRLYYEVTIDFEDPGALSSNDTAMASITNDNGTFTTMFSQNLTESAGSSVMLDVSASLDELYVSSGDYVQKGDLLAKFSSESLEEQITSAEIDAAKARLSYEKSLGDSAVYSPVSGTVVSVDAHSGDSIDDNTVAVTVSNIDALKAVVPIDESDINQIIQGQEAIVTFTSSDDVFFDGKVNSISLEGNSSNGTVTFDTTIGIEPTGSDFMLLPGMNIDASIIIGSASDVLRLPVEAIQSKGSTYFVITNPDGEGFDRITEVEVGLISSTYAEISSGLNENDTVYYAQEIGSYASKDAGFNLMPGSGGGEGKRRPD